MAKEKDVVDQVRQNAHIGQRCKELRLQAGIKRKDMAELSEISEVAIFNFESSSVFNLDSFWKYVEVLHAKCLADINFIVIKDNKKFNPVIVPDISNLNTIRDLSNIILARDREIIEVKNELEAVKRKLKAVR
jgi:transcriptional regulator with XRE-family HTH domain